MTTLHELCYTGTYRSKQELHAVRKSMDFSSISKSSNRNQTPLLSKTTALIRYDIVAVGLDPSCGFISWT
jgi:hypothetical protein